MSIIASNTGSDKQLSSKTEVATVVIVLVSKNAQPTKSEIQAKWSKTKYELEQGEWADGLAHCGADQPKSLPPMLKMEAAAWSLIPCHPHL
jgi:ribonuclease HI